MHKVSLTTLLVTFSISTFAHHGGGTFNLSDTVTYGGILTEVKIINPHSWIYFDTRKEDGTTSKYRCEMRSGHTLRRSGWSKELLPLGQKITVTGSPDRKDPNSCYLQTILFEDGSRMDRYGQYVQAPEGGALEIRGQVLIPDTDGRELRLANGEPNITGDWAPEQRVMIDPRGVGGGGFASLNELSELVPGEVRPSPRRAQPTSPDGAKLYGGTELTVFGKEEIENILLPENNPRFNCETTSIIFDWAYDGAVNQITQYQDTITFLYGQMNLERTIYMDMKEHPANYALSRDGHSIGRWEEDVLIVDTIGFLPGVLVQPVGNSSQLHITERFSLDPETQHLSRSYIAQDPVFLKGQYSGSDTLETADFPYVSDNCNDLRLIDYSQRGQ